MTDPTPADVERGGGPTQPDHLGPGMAASDEAGGVAGVGAISADLGEDSGALDEHGRDAGARKGAEP